jgi:hypothetical protein
MFAHQLARRTPLVPSSSFTVTKRFYPAVKPPVKRPDPLRDVPAQKLDGGNLTFYHRPPPSSPSPYSLSSAPASPLLRPPSSAVNLQPAPISDPSAPPALRPLPEPKKHHITESQAVEMRQLRAEGWSRLAVARKFKCSPVLVSIVAPATKEKYNHHWEKMEKVREGWGPRKRVLREVRAKRREFW